MDGRQDRYLREQEESIAERRRLVIAAHESQGPFIGSIIKADCVMTGTYSPRHRYRATETVLGVEVARRVSRWKALRDAERLVDEASRLVGWPVAAVISVEPHLDRSYHLHGVLDLRGARQAYLGALKWWWSERYGFCHFERPRSVAAVSRYIGKHLAGPESDVWFSPGLIR